jgi:hypothetical protein
MAVAMRREICVILGLLLVLPILGCVTTSRHVYEKEIVFDELSYEAMGRSCRR